MLRTATALLLLALTPRAQAPNLDLPHPLPGDTAAATAFGVQMSPALAAGGGVTLAVWADARAGTYDVLATRLDAAGAPLEPLPFPIASGPGDQIRPQVEWNGSSFLVAWVSQEPTAGYYEDTVRAARVSAAGAVLDPTPLTLAGGASSFALGTDGAGFLLVKQGAGPSSALDLLGYRVSAQGVVLDPAGLLLVPGGYSMIYNFDVAFTNGTWLLAWGDTVGATGWDVLGRRFDGALHPLDLAPVGLASTFLTEIEPQLAAANGEFLLVYWNEAVYWSEGVLARRFDTTLQPLDAAPLAVSGTGFGAVSYQPWPAAAWDGSRWIVAWRGMPTMRAARISAAGALLDPGGVALGLGAASESCAVAPRAGGGARVAWTDLRFGTGDIFQAGLDAAGGALPEAPVALGAASHGEPRLVPNGHGYLAVARSATAEGGRILAWRTDSLGHGLDAEPFEVAAAESYGAEPSAAWNGSLYLIAWTDAGTGGFVLGRRMLPDGTFLDAAPFPILKGLSADVAALGDLFLVVTDFYPSYPEYIFTFGARVRGTDGAVLDSPALWIGESYSVRPRVTALADRWMVVTERHWTHDESNSSISVHTVLADGSLGAGAGVASAIVPFAWGGSTDIAGAGDAALVVYNSGTNQINIDVYARLVHADGTFGGPAKVLTGLAPSGQMRPSVAWTGAEFVVAYESYQENPLFFDQRPDVYAVRVDAGGQPLDPVGFPVWQAEIEARRPDTAALGGGRGMLAASVYDAAGAAALRVELRALRPAGLASYGTGTPGCGGPQHLDADSEPYVGNPGLRLVCAEAPPLALGYGIFSSVADVPGSDPFGLGVLTHVGVPAPLFVPFHFATDAQGNAASGAFPVPGDAAMAGTVLYAQAAFFWSGPCLPSFSGFSTSDGLALTLQP